MKQHQVQHASRRGWNDLHKHCRIYVAHIVKPIAQKLREPKFPRHKPCAKAAKEKPNLRTHILLWMRKGLGSLIVRSQRSLQFQAKTNRATSNMLHLPKTIGNNTKKNGCSWCLEVHMSIIYKWPIPYVEQRKMQLVPNTDWRTALAWWQQPRDRRRL